MRDFILPIVVSPAIFSGQVGIIDEALGFNAEGLDIIKTAWGGCWTLTLSKKCRQVEAEEWIEEGLARHVEMYNPETVPIFEGYVSEVRANIGALSLTVGPLLDYVANRVRVIYSTMDYSNVPPVPGMRVPTDWADDVESQLKYGIIERTKSLSGADPTLADQARDLMLQEMREPRRRERENVGSSTTPSIELVIRGYIDWLKAYTYTSTTTGLITATAKLQNVLGADPNSIFSTDYTLIETNSSSVGAWEDEDRSGWTLGKGLTAIGDSSNNRWLLGFRPGRQPFYKPVPTAPAYTRRMTDPAQWTELFGNLSRVMPYDVEPGEWLVYTDLMIGRSTPADIRVDPRYLFIEENAFTVPWALRLEGSEFGRLDQLLARQTGTAGAAS